MNSIRMNVAIDTTCTKSKGKPVKTYCPHIRRVPNFPAVTVNRPAIVKSPLNTMLSLLTEFPNRR